jgi:uncharacterized protein (DUF2267 family)
MAESVADIFNVTIEKTNLWLKDIMTELDWDDRYKAYVALRAVLQTLRDRLTIEEAAQLGAQLPMLVRGFYYEGWNPTGKPVKERHRDDFLRHIQDYFRNDEAVVPEKVTRAVFKVLSWYVTRGEIKDVKGILPKDIQTLWS